MHTSPVAAFAFALKSSERPEITWWTEGEKKNQKQKHRGLIKKKKKKETRRTGVQSINHMFSSDHSHWRTGVRLTDSLCWRNLTASYTTMSWLPLLDLTCKRSSCGVFNDGKSKERSVGKLPLVPAGECDSSVMLIDLSVVCILDKLKGN